MGSVSGFMAKIQQQVEVRGIEVKRIDPDGFIEKHQAKGLEQSAAQNKRFANERALKMMKKSGVSQKLLTASFDNYQVTTPGQKNALEAAKNYANKFSSDQGFIFFGSPGTGKNHLACAITNQLIANGFSVLLTTVQDLMSEIKESYRNDSTATERQAIEKFVKPDLLIIDEIGLQNGKNFEEIVLTTILDKRVTSLKPTGILTNLNVGQELENVLGFRAIERIHEGNPIVVQFDWNSFGRR